MIQFHTSFDSNIFTKDERRRYITVLKNKRPPANANPTHVVTAPLVVVAAAACSVTWDVAALFAVGCTARAKRFLELPENVTWTCAVKPYVRSWSTGTVKKSAVKSITKAAVFVVGVATLERMAGPVMPPDA